MKFFFKFRRFAVLVAVLLFAGMKVEAQSFGSGLILSVTNSANSIQTSNSLTYTINVTNFLGDLSDAEVTNTLPASVQILSATPSFGGDVTNFGSVVVFDIGQFNLAGVAQMSLTVEPTAAGFITNMVVLSGFNVTNTATTNVVTQVTNAIPPSADLGVVISVPAMAVIVNDLIAYGVSVTNGGPSSAPNVALTNTLPAGMVFKGVSPTNQAFTIVASNLIFNLGTLTNGANKNLQLSIQPTNAGVLNFSAAVGASGILDTNMANNTASNSIIVTNYFTGQLLAFTNSGQIVNRQNGLLEQSITLTNLGTNAVAAARVVVTGLTNRLFNATGTNNGSPFVTYAATLGTNQGVNLLLQYFPRNLFPFSNGQLQAFAVPLPDLAPPGALSTSTNLNLSLISLANGNMLLQFPAITNRTYTVVYSDNVLFSNAMIAPPSIVAPANVVQWIDYGPPATISSPANSSTRFYRVFLNP
jgi:uncharacterized repeat protein (TIGR01451 family)